MSKYDKIPAGACTFAAPLTIGDNGDDSKTAPFELLARSSKPIEHWYWGNVVHDMAGAFGKERIPIDYNHGEEIGFSNKRSITDEGLRLSGALVSVKEDDMAHTVMKRSKAGIPYEASINFGGDGIVVEEVPDGTFVEVNGYQFTNGVVIRKFPIRGCAFCLYGADGNTETQLFKDAGTVSASIVKPVKEAAEMSKPENTDAVEAIETAVELAQVEAVEEQPAAPVAELQAVEDEAVEVAPAAVEAVEPEADEPVEATFSQSDIAGMVTEFGSEIALQVVTNGGTYEDAKELHNEAKEAELVSLRAEVAELKARPVAPTGATPAAFASNDTPGKPAKKNIRDAAVRRTN
jgi:hypothetical protein